jgi:hypothetical protein
MKKKVNVVKGLEEIIKNEKQLAQKVVDVYPSLEKLLQHEVIPSILSREELFFVSNKVHLLSAAVDKMCKSMYDLGFYKSTFFVPEDDPFDFNTGKNIDGNALVYDSQGNTYEVNYIEFIALTKMMFCSFLGIELSTEQFKAQDEFKCIQKIYKIID